MGTVQLNYYALTQSDYISRVQSGFYEHDPDIQLFETEKTYDHLMGLIGRVNPALYWDQQSKLKDRAAVEARLADKQTRLFVIMDGDQAIGFSMSKAPAQRLTEKFAQAAHHSARFGEIDYLAMFHGHEGGGRGKAAFLKMFEWMFDQYDVVGWSQYSTNAPSLKRWYIDVLGMQWLGADEVEDFRPAGAADFKGYVCKN